MGDNGYRRPEDFRAAVEARLKTVAKVSERPLAEVLREFLYQRFLARVFVEDPGLWILKGGIGLLTRMPGARHSLDVDLMHEKADRVEAEQEIRRIGRKDLHDHLRFEIVKSEPMSVDAALRLTTCVYIGTAEWMRFHIDISCERHFVATVEIVQPKPIIDLAGVPELPAFRLYPLADQIADKVAAMYETHGNAPSNRYRDLVDLVLLTGIEQLEAVLLSAALRAREQNSRNRLELPKAMMKPGPGWERGYRAQVVRSVVPVHSHALDLALSYVGACLDPILDGSVGDAARWIPTTRSWVP